MTTDDLHEVTFIWPRTDAASVIVTGTFDNWSKSIPLKKSWNGFTGSIKIHWNETIAYKYIVDGNWSLDDSKPKRVEFGGYVNNTYVAPSKPSSPQEVPAKTPSETLVLHLNGTMNGIKTEHPGDASAAQDVLDATEVSTKMPDELECKTNGHIEMSERPQATPSVQETDKAGVLSTEEGMESTPVDSHPADGEGAATAVQGVADRAEGVSQAEEHKEEGKPVESVPEPVRDPAETADEPADSTCPKVEQEVSQVASYNGNAAPSIPGERKRSPIMPFVPVNVPPEIPRVNGMQNSLGGITGKEASTHKPLGPVAKASQPPTTTAESATSSAEQIAAKHTTEETPVQPERTTAEAASHPEKAPEPAAVEPEDVAVRPTAAPAPATQSPLSQPDATGATQCKPEEKPTDIPSAASPVATPATAVETPTDTTQALEPTAASLAPVPTETKLAGKSPSAPSSPTKAKFPRVSRESSASEPPQIGKTRKRKSTFLEKIKHIFSHDKEKGKGKSKK